MAKLSSKRRNSLPSSAFAEPKKRKYPLDTKNRAKNALSRVSHNGTEAEKATIRRKVHSRYPSIGESGFSKAKGRKSHNGRRKTRVK